MGESDPVQPASLRRSEVEEKTKSVTQRLKGTIAQRKDLLTEDRISAHIVGAAIEAHRTLGGPGLLESVYEEALIWELNQRGLSTERQKIVPINYKGSILATPLRLDLVVDELVIVECKSVVAYNPIFEAQTLTYLRLTGLKLALVINFGDRLVKNGIHRVVN